MERFIGNMGSAVVPRHPGVFESVVLRSYSHISPGGSASGIRNYKA